MWAVQGTNLQMVEGDYGIILPVAVSGTVLEAGDSLKFVFLQARNSEAVLEKELSTIVDNTVELEFSEQESALFSVRTYIYRLDWYRDGAFMCNLIPEALFKVVEKA